MSPFFKLTFFTLLTTIGLYSIYLTLLVTLGGLGYTSPNISTAILAIILLLTFVLSLLRLDLKTTAKIRNARPSKLFKNLYFWIFAGLVLRTGCFYLNPTHPVSDTASYVDLAMRIINFQDYETYPAPWQTLSTKAYWPPGYPIFLAITHLFTFKPTAQTLLFVNSGLFIVSCYLGYGLASNIFNKHVAITFVALFSLWPNLITLSTVGSKELLIIPLLLVSLILFLKGRKTKKQLYFLATGLSLGATAMVQPSFILFWTVFVAFFLINQVSLKFSTSAIFMIILGMALAISPWTARNYMILNNFVLISTNGGDNLYRANNPLATGGFAPRGEVDLSKLDEIETNKKGAQLALNWIISNPKDFILLSVEKHKRFLGDDTNGIYFYLKYGSDNSVPELVYLLVKSVARLCWASLWILIVILCIKNRNLIIHECNSIKKQECLSYAVLIFLYFLYLFAIHSVAESYSKYHVPVLWVPLLLLAVLIHLPDKPESSLIEATVLKNNKVNSQRN